MGSRSLRQTGAQRTGEMLVVGVSSRAGAGCLLGSGGDQRCWGAHTCVCISVGEKEGRKDRKGMGFQFAEIPFPIRTVICCVQFFLRNLFLCVCI